MTLVSILTIAALSINSPVAACDSNMGAQFRPFVECAAARGKALEPSKESADNIATAALNYCSPLRSAALKAVEMCFVDDPTFPRSVMDKTARDVVIARIVEMRAGVTR